MPVTNTYDGNTPTQNADYDVWGAELNTALVQIKATLDAFVTAINADTTVASAALPKAGGIMTGDVVLADLGPGSALSGGFRGLPTISFDTNRTLGLTDCGKAMRIFGSTARTITIPPVGTVAFPIGTVIPVRSYSTATITIARGLGVELRVPGTTTNADQSITTLGFGTLYHEDTNIWLLLS